MNEHDGENGVKDRKLGDEWLGWDGSTTTENETNEKPGTFFILAVWSVLVLAACCLLGWYLTKPRFDQISPVLSSIMGWSAIALTAAIIIASVLEIALLMKFGKSLFPYTLTEKLLLSLLPKSMWLGVRLGMSKDRVGNSFIKAHNLVVKSHAREVNADVLLILLPRCLQKDARREVVERVNGRAAQIITVAGGEEARKAIRQHKPSLILAVACERDLISGIRDVAEKIHVLAIPNKRPEGPCKNTYLRLDALEDALKFITEREGKAVTP
jgi:uncharacterized protein